MINKQIQNLARKWDAPRMLDANGPPSRFILQNRVRNPNPDLSGLSVDRQHHLGDRVRSREDRVTGTVMRREHDFEHPRYVIEWDDGQQIEIWPDEGPDLDERLQPAV